MFREVTTLRREAAAAGRTRALIVCPSWSVKKLDFARLRKEAVAGKVVLIGVNRMCFMPALDFLFMGIDPMRLEAKRFSQFQKGICNYPGRVVVPVFEERQYVRHPEFSKTIPANYKWIHELAEMRDVWWWTIGSARHFGIPEELPKAEKKVHPLDVSLYRNEHFRKGVFFTSKTVTIGATEFARFLGCSEIGIIGNDLQTDGDSISGYYCDNRASHYKGGGKQEGKFPTDFDLAIRAFNNCAAEGMFKGAKYIDFTKTNRIDVFPKRHPKELWDWLEGN